LPDGKTLATGAEAVTPMVAAVGLAALEE